LVRMHRANRSDSLRIWLWLVWLEFEAAVPEGLELLGELEPQAASTMARASAAAVAGRPAAARGMTGVISSRP
jgi:hypothetical protein